MHENLTRSSPPGARRSIELAILDMDGVIFRGHNFWLDLHREYGTTEAGVALAERFIDGDYGLLAEHVAGRLWRGRDSEPFERLVNNRAYEEGIAELFEFFKQHNIPTAVISSGPNQLAQRAQLELGIDVVRANHVEIAEGRITGRAVIEVPDSEKLRVGLEVMRQFDTSPEHTLFIGDSSSDAALADLVAVGIAYNTESEALRNACDHVLKPGELAKVISIIESRLRDDGKFSESSETPLGEALR